MSQTLMSKGQQAKAAAQTPANTSVPVLAVAAPSNALPVDQTTQTANDFVTKVKTFFTKPISAGSKIQYWHVAVGAVALFVLYVEMIADRKTQRKLKFW